MMRSGEMKPATIEIDESNHGGALLIAHPVTSKDDRGVNKPVRVSLAIPVYNEEAVVPELIRRTTSVLDSIPGGPYEIVL
jgi:hypothetical protein